MSRFIYFIVLGLLVAASCKKAPDSTAQVNSTTVSGTVPAQPKSSFSTNVLYFSNAPAYTKASTINRTDSLFYFKNTSETGADITYKWDFGDGTTSSLKDASHAYSNVGQYIVKLIATRSNQTNQASDTSQALLNVIMGQREIMLGANIHTEAINLVETNDGGYLLLGYAYSTQISPAISNNFLIKFDSNFRQTSVKMLPAGMQLKNITACSDGNYAFTGTTSGKSVYNEIIKITADGTLLWSKVLNSENFTDIQQTSDNGFILTGMRTIVGQYDEPKSLVIKTDANGNVLWEKFFGQGLILESTANVNVETDGYMLAGVKRKNTAVLPVCDCDSVTTVKLNSQGVVQSSNTHLWIDQPSIGYGYIYISKMQNNGYAVTCRSDSHLFLFNTSGAYVDSKKVGEGWHSASSAEGNVLILSWLNDTTTRLYSYSVTGTPGWSVLINNDQTLPAGGYDYNYDSWPVVVKPLKAGGAVFLANNYFTGSSGYTAVIVRVDKNGVVQ